jgi:hypothetical protein
MRAGAMGEVLHSLIAQPDASDNPQTVCATASGRQFRAMFVHQAGDSGLSDAWAEIACDVDAGQVLRDIAEKDGNHRPAFTPLPSSPRSQHRLRRSDSDRAWRTAG